MDMTIKQLATVVIAALREADYMESTIGNYKKTIKALTQFAGGEDQAYTAQLGAEFSAMTTSPRTGKFSAVRRFDYTRLINLYDSYVTTGVVVLAAAKRGGGGPRPVGAELVALNAAWEHDMAQRGLAAETQDYYGRLTRAYLVFLEERDIKCIEDADGASVLAFLESISRQWANTSMYGIVTNFRPFLKFTQRGDLVGAINTVRARRPHAIPPVIADADQQLVVDACASGAVSARDAAITLLALLTGLRACDIIGMRLVDINWRAQVLQVVQQKTGNPVTLPLPALVITKLAAYVLSERPEGADDRVFLRSLAPHTGLADHASIHRVISTTFRKAGVAQPNAGTRVLRHNAASKLLQAGVALPTIAAVLGHTSDESTNVYLSTDHQGLLHCVLPVPAGVQS